MYEELVKNLRVCSKCDFGQNCNECTQESEDKFCCDILLHKAADAIEKLNRVVAAWQRLFLMLNERLVKEKKKNEWIPVTDRLPPIGEEVIVFADRTTIRIWSLERYHSTIADVFWEREDGYHEDADVVSHWMPLPQPPKDGEA